MWNLPGIKLISSFKKLPLIEVFYCFLIANNYIKTQQFHLAGKFGLEEKCSAIEEEDSVENVEEGFQEGREAAEHLESGLLVTEVLVGWDKVTIMKHQDGWDNLQKRGWH